MTDRNKNRVSPVLSQETRVLGAESLSVSDECSD
jgi:hypothetical protein